MTVRLNRTKASPFNLSSQDLDKFIRSQKNLSKPIPKLFPDHHNAAILLPHQDNQEEKHTLTLNHPILRKLDSIRPTLFQFNQVHTQLVILNLFQHPLAASRAIKKLCSSHWTLPHALKVFENQEHPDAFLCNTIMRAYLNHAFHEKVLCFYYDEMLRKRRVFANNYTFPVLIKACADMGLTEEAEKIHAHVVKCGFELDLYVRNGLIHLYGVCGRRVQDAEKVFDISYELDLVSWNTMIDVYVKNGKLGSARMIFDQMLERDVFSWNSMISGYVGNGEMEAARDLFEEMECKDIVSWNCMMDGYTRIGNVKVARDLFDRMDYRNVVSWNTILALYVHVKDYDECLKLFDRMMQEGDVMPNEATLMSVLTACAHLGRLDRGEWIHSYIRYNGRIEPDVLLWTALLTMYAKCGAMDLAKDVFDEMPKKTVVSWNSMIMAYGMHGQGEKALEMFLEMEKCGVMPNDATFVCILSACTHAGMVLEGWWYFDLMHKVYKIEPQIKHYGCMVDLLGRAGLINESAELVKKMPTQGGPALRGALLSACRTHSNLQLGEIVAKQLIKLEPGDMGPYLLLSNIYAAEGRWDNVEYVRKMMMENRVNKAPGSSLVQFKDSGNELLEGNKSMHKQNMVYSMLTEMGVQIKLTCRTATD